MTTTPVEASRAEAKAKLVRLFEALEREGDYKLDLQYCTITDTKVSVTVASLISIDRKIKLGWYINARNRRDGMTTKEASTDEIVVELLDMRSRKFGADVARRLRTSREVLVGQFLKELQEDHDGKRIEDRMERAKLGMPALSIDRSRYNHDSDNCYDTVKADVRVLVSVTGLSDAIEVRAPAVFRFEKGTNVLVDVVGVNQHGSITSYKQYLNNLEILTKEFSKSL